MHRHRRGERRRTAVRRLGRARFRRTLVVVLVVVFGPKIATANVSSSTCQSSKLTCRESNAIGDCEVARVWLGGRAVASGAWFVARAVQAVCGRTG